MFEFRGWSRILSSVPNTQATKVIVDAQAKQATSAGKTGVVKLKIGAGRNTRAEKKNGEQPKDKKQKIRHSQGVKLGVTPLKIKDLPETVEQLHSLAADNEQALVELMRRLKTHEGEWVKLT